MFLATPQEGGTCFLERGVVVGVGFWCRGLAEGASLE